MIAAVIQMKSSTDRRRNWEIAAHYIEQAAAAEAKLVVLPEYFSFLRASGKDPVLSEPLNGPTFEFLSHLARRHGLWIVGGSFYQRSGLEHKHYNTSVLIDADGRMVDHYQKIHLSSARGGAARNPYSEKSHLLHGQRQWVHSTPLGNLGVAICYDLRFPESVRGLRLRGAHIVAAPCAFFTSPGERQWEAIIRTRAIDNQCYMLVAAQWGEYAPQRHALGFSMIVDPVGDVLGKCEPKEGVVMADINPEFVEQWRYNLDFIAQARMLPARLSIKKAENQ
jgi:nitrilase